MPEYVWQFVCGIVADGEYRFPEGTVTVSNGWVSWEPAE